MNAIKLLFLFSLSGSAIAQRNCEEYCRDIDWGRAMCLRDCEQGRPYLVYGKGEVEGIGLWIGVQPYQEDEARLKADQSVLGLCFGTPERISEYKMTVDYGSRILTAEATYECYRFTSRHQ